MCIKCLELKKRKVERPSKEKLLKLSKVMSSVKIGEMFGVSANSIKKWCLSYGMILPDMRSRWKRTKKD